ncbi:MAG TPA: hypothetical protein VN894_09155 [Polyangiaceae bacterium]|nr:hypothetical protein [Polyangiaceae bacterium]
MRAATIITAGLVALTIGVVAHADQKADQKFCASAAAFESNVAELNAIGPHSTVAELRAATKRVEKSANDMEKAADKMKTPAAKQFTEAMKQLKNDVDTIPDDATLKQVRSKISADSQNARSTGEQVAAEAGCPAPPPPQE